MTSKWDIEHGQWMAEYREQEESEASPAAPCSALDKFLEVMKSGTLQHCVHDEWSDCDLEKITIGYLMRARQFRIVKQNEREQP